MNQNPISNPAVANRTGGVHTTALHTDTVHTSASVAPLARRMSWGAIIAGGVIAIVVQLVLSLLGAGIGLGMVDPLQADSPSAGAFGIGAAAWWAVSSVIALFLAGWVAGHLAGTADGTDAMLHGLLTWGVATILTVYLLASAIGGVVRGGASMLGSVASVAGGAAAAAAGPAAAAAKRTLDESGISFDGLKAQAQELLRQTGKPALQPGAAADAAATAASGGAPAQTAASGAVGDAASTPAAGAPAAGAAGDDLTSVIQRVIGSGKSTVEQVDREAMVNVVMARTGASRTDAEARVDGWIGSYQQTRAKFEEQKAAAQAKAREAADATAQATSRGALGAVVALLLGAIAAALGGRFARRKLALLPGGVGGMAVQADARV